jgi:energy-coupling factor transporter ATP-binding protein EcfA2
MNKQSFKLPIEYVKNLKVDTTIINDLAFEKMYKDIYGNDSKASELNIECLYKYYTNDKLYLKDTQQLINSKLIKPPCSNDVINIMKDIDENKHFLNKYHYIDYEKIKFLNTKPEFMQCLSLYSIASPLLSLAMPIFLLIIPFIIIRSQGCPITMSKYFETLRNTLKNHSIGKLFSIGSESWDKRVYILITVVFYLFQVYSNIQSCKTYFVNMKKIHSTIFTMRDYISVSVKNIENYLKHNEGLQTYTKFHKDLKYYKSKLYILLKKYNEITLFEFSLSKLNELGKIMSMFYELNMDESNKITFSYLVYFNGYIENILSIKNKFIKKQINYCSFSKTKTSFKNIYFPAVINKKTVTNNISIQNNIIITGPNAAGKTTILKSILFNIIFTQQTGLGFYNKCSIKLYDNICSYINIPDSSDRDSLFQAEARRCSNILLSIKENENTICFFDELYSGTNPYEAIASATAFLKYINNIKNVKFVITTHFINVCKLLDSDPNIQNFNMEIINNNNNIKYTYKIKKGISDVKGGLLVLKQLKYPDKIINDANNILSKIVL